MAECASCGKKFEAARKDARYCSAACRKASSRDVTDKLIKPVTSGNEKPVTLTTGLRPPDVTLSAFVKPDRKPPGTGFPAGYTGEHAGHAIFPHNHTPYLPGLYKPCSGRWFCESCKPDGYPGTWFSAVKCYEVAA